MAEPNPGSGDPEAAPAAADEPSAPAAVEVEVDSAGPEREPEPAGTEPEPAGTEPEAEAAGTEPAPEPALAGGAEPPMPPTIVDSRVGPRPLPSSPEGATASSERISLGVNTVTIGLGAFTGARELLQDLSGRFKGLPLAGTSLVIALAITAAALGKLAPVLRSWRACIVVVGLGLGLFAWWRVDPGVFDTDRDAVGVEDGTATGDDRAGDEARGGTEDRSDGSTTSTGPSTASSSSPAGPGRQDSVTEPGGEVTIPPNGSGGTASDGSRSGTTTGTTGTTGTTPTPTTPQSFTRLGTELRNDGWTAQDNVLVGGVEASVALVAPPVPVCEGDDLSQVVEYELGGNYTTLAVDLGVVSELSDPGVAVRITLWGEEGPFLWSGRFVRGEEKYQEIPLNSNRHLRIVAVGEPASASSSPCPKVVAALGDPNLR